MNSIVVFFFSSRRRHTSCALVTGVQTCALPISVYFAAVVALYAGLLVLRWAVPAEQLVDDEGEPLITSSDVGALVVAGMISVIALVVLFLADRQSVV